MSRAALDLRALVAGLSDAGGVLFTEREPRGGVGGALAEEPDRLEALHGGASSSARRRNRLQHVHEDAVLRLKRLRAVVLVVSRGHHDNEIEFRDDTHRLPASTERANPVDLTPIEQGAAEPPQVSI